MDCWIAGFVKNPRRFAAVRYLLISISRLAR
jgi:hypothetical protein